MPSFVCRCLPTALSPTLENLTDLSKNLEAGAGSSKQSGTPSNLTSTILDTMLCILVDSTPALRAFEQCNGVQAIVKILKRAGSPREVRMKRLEFLYFYLLDETKPSTATASSAESTFVDLVPTVPNTPSQSRTSNSSYGSRSSIFPPTVPNTPHESSHSRQSSQSILRGVSNSSISSASSVSSAGSNSQHSVTRGQTKKPYLNGLAAPNRPSPKARSEYGSSTFSFPHSSYSGPSVKSDASEKGYVMESSPSSRSNSDSGKAGIGRQVVTEGEANTFRSVSSGSAKSFTSTSSTTSAASTSSISTTSSTITALGSTECSPSCRRFLLFHLARSSKPLLDLQKWNSLLRLDLILVLAGNQGLLLLLEPLLSKAYLRKRPWDHSERCVGGVGGCV
ncbi:cell division control protein 14, SIN component-domain-containing protein [Lentinula detonsa]|uniref:Cell division control protein 14, SIN component-domain-containing protein n=1 Tax=Lentinula detonsa TaxID=2804962 RepID=A0AA38Q2K4_9AGAR|nr:cell division control protein 14, SIN component-domain-containing protein [Lentinula detonsa]